MCEILINAIDSSHADPAKDLLCWKTGDPVVVFDDGHQWGRQEGLPKFWVVQIVGVTAAQALKYVDSTYDPTVSDSTSLKRKRLYRLSFSNLPSSAQTNLTTTGRTSLTWQQIRKAIFNKDTGASE